MPACRQSCLPASWHACWHAKMFASMLVSISKRMNRFILLKCLPAFLFLVQVHSFEMLASIFIFSSASANQNSIIMLNIKDCSLFMELYIGLVLEN